MDSSAKRTGGAMPSSGGLRERSMTKKAHYLSAAQQSKVRISVSPFRKGAPEELTQYWPHLALAMKIWTSDHVFNHSWETVVQAAWRKYPNPMNPAVLGTDVIDRKVVDGVLHTHRLVTSEWGLPGWARSIVGPSGVCYASECSEVDPKTREMKLQTRNLSFGSLVAVDEKLTYQPCPNDSSKTLLKQEAIVTVHGVPLSNYLENILTNNISCNASKGRQAIEWVIGKIETEMTDLKNSAVKNKDEIITQTRKSIDEFRSSTRKTLDEMLLT